MNNIKFFLHCSVYSVTLLLLSSCLALSSYSTLVNALVHDVNADNAVHACIQDVNDPSCLSLNSKLYTNQSTLFSPQQRTLAQCLTTNVVACKQWVSSEEKIISESKTIRMIPATLTFNRLIQPSSIAPHHIIEVFVDYVCPFSAKLFKTLHQSIMPFLKKNNNIELIFRHQVQPWHPQSTLTHETALAVGKLDPSKFLPFSAALFEHQEKFFDMNVYNKSRSQIYEELAEFAESSVGVKKKSILDLLSYVPSDTGSKNNGNHITEEVKWCIKYSRHNQVHVSPSVLIDGMISSNISSSSLLPDWKKVIQSI